MYSVMIVDDEMLVRMGLKAMVNWEELGFEIVAEASDGQVAFEKFLVEKPEIVITDIKMPKKDGLWLTERIKADYPDTEIVILTCYDEFDFVRKALKLHAADYILKAEMEEEDIRSILLQKKELFDKRRSQKEAVRESKGQAGDRLLGMLLDVKYTMADVYNLLEELKVSYQGKRSCFVIFDFGENLATEKYSQEKAANVVIVCMQLIENELAKHSEQFYVKRLGKSIVAFLLDDRLTEQKMQKMIGNIRASIGGYFNISAKAAVTTPVGQVWESRSQLAWLYDAVNYLFYISGDEILTPENYTGRSAEVFLPDQELFSKIVFYVLAGNSKQAFIEVLFFFEQMKVVQKDVFDFKLTVTHLIADMFKELHAYLESMDEANEYMRRIMQGDDLIQITGLTEECLSFVESQVVKARVENSDILVRKAQIYMEEHYSRKITLDEVAGEIGISRFYFSTLFRQATGIKFSIYLNEIRIKRAKELLKNPAVTISQVYDQVGFHDPQYFSKTFKKYTGMTVKEYREQF